jgi:hypothetical protein
LSAPRRGSWGTYQPFSFIASLPTASSTQPKKKEKPREQGSKLFGGLLGSGKRRLNQSLVQRLIDGRTLTFSHHA